MARFNSVQVEPEGNAIRLRFQIDTPGVIGWQLLDPTTGAFLFEGEWIESSDRTVDLRIVMPEGDGPYQVRVAPVADRSRFLLMNATVTGESIDLTPARISTLSAERRGRFARAIPKAFTYPVRSVWTNRKLVATMVRRDILSRYKGSMGGALWTFLNPILLLATYFFVFGVVMKARFGADTSRSGFVLYFLAGMLPWLAFAEAVGRAPQVILEHRNFVKKLVFPLEILPFNMVMTGVVTEGFAALIFLIFVLVARGGIPLTGLYLPLLLIPQILITAGVCWFLAALGVYFRDLTQITGFVLQLVFYLTPILYPESGIPAAVAPVLKLNPMLFLIRAYRGILLESKPPEWQSLLALTLGGAVLAILGHAWFHKVRRTFADVI